MRTIGDFINARIALAGFKTLGDFTSAAGLTRPTLYRLTIAKTADSIKSQRATLERIADTLRFREWADLVDAWKADDVRRRLDTVFVELPREIYELIAERAARRGVDVPTFITQIAVPKTGRIIDRDPPNVDPARGGSPAPSTPGKIEKRPPRAREQVR